jgi:excisionase family DNA binding protein
MNEIKKTEDRLLKVEDVAQMLSIKPVTVYQWYKQGRLKGFKLGRKLVRFRKTEVDSFLQEIETGKEYY